jgi:hypothetical protein
VIGGDGAVWAYAIFVWATVAVVVVVVALALRPLTGSWRGPGIWLAVCALGLAVLGATTYFSADAKAARHASGLRDELADAAGVALGQGDYLKRTETRPCGAEPGSTVVASGEAPVPAGGESRLVHRARAALASHGYRIHVRRLQPAGLQIGGRAGRRTARFYIAYGNVTVEAADGCWDVSA